VARDEELPVLVAELGEAEFFADRLERQREGLGDLLVAWLDERPAGEVYLRREPHPHPDIWANLPDVPVINHLEVAEAYRRRGVGTALLAEAERHAFAHGHSLVCLAVGVDNPARALYDARGYEDWGHGPVTFEWEGGTEICHILLKFVDPDVPGLDAWDAWHPRDAAALLASCPVPWAVAGGWAIDVYLGRQTREHGDLEVAIPRARFAAYRPYFHAFDLYDVGAGRVRRLGPEDEPDPEHHQVWACEQAFGLWRMDTFLEPGDDETWVSHRDPRIRMPMSAAVRHSPEGIAYLAPEIVLLTKAKHARAKDEADLAVTLPTVDDEARRWLADAIALAHPGHAWLAAVRD
jgi:GNAT superfamily N-acetyltransferase